MALPTILFLFLQIGINPSIQHPSDDLAIREFLKEYNFETENDRNFAYIYTKRIENLEIMNTNPNYNFYYFPTNSGSPTGHIGIVVNNLGNVEKIGEVKNFNEVVKNLDLKVTNTFQAQQIANDFFKIRFIHFEVWEGVNGGVNFISKVEEIPFEDGQIEARIEKFDLLLNHKISPPKWVESESKFLFQGYSWAPFGGEVVQHNLVIGSKGEIVDYKTKRIASAYGDYKTGCTFPLDFGPEIPVLATLSKSENPEVRKAVVDYFLYIKKSDFILYEIAVENHKNEILEILEDLKTDPDPEIQSFAEKVYRKVK